MVEDEAKSSILNSGETVVEDKIYLRPQGNLLRSIDNKTLEDRWFQIVHKFSFQ